MTAQRCVQACDARNCRWLVGDDRAIFAASPRNSWQSIEAYERVERDQLAYLQ
jgi:hypothetical protein